MLLFPKLPSKWYNEQNELIWRKFSFWQFWFFFREINIATLSIIRCYVDLHFDHVRITCLKRWPWQIRIFACRYFQMRMKCSTYQVYEYCKRKKIMIKMGKMKIISWKQLTVQLLNAKKLYYCNDFVAKILSNEFFLTNKSNFTFTVTWFDEKMYFTEFLVKSMRHLLISKKLISRNIFYNDNLLFLLENCILKMLQK